MDLENRIFEIEFDLSEAKEILLEYNLKNKISKVNIRICSSDILENQEPGFCITDFLNADFSSVKIQNVPAGKNRIICIEPFDKNKDLIPQLILKNYFDCGLDDLTKKVFKKDKQNFSILLFELKNYFKDLHNPSKKTKEQLEYLFNSVNTEVQPGLFDFNSLIGEYTAFSPLRSKNSYTLKTGSLEFSYLLEQEIFIVVDDPLSKKEKFKAAKNLCLNGIAPGTWTLKVLSKDDEILNSMEVVVDSEKITQLKHLETKGISLVFNNLSWENFKKNKDQYKEIKLENETLYVKNFLNCNKLDLVYNQKNDAVRIEHTGVYFFDSATTSQPVELTTFEGTILNLEDYNFTEKNYKTLFYDDSKNRQFIFLLNTKVIKTKTEIQNAKIQFNRGINDLNYRGETFKLIYDDYSIVWYAVIPYEKIRSTNQSGQPTYRLKINGKEFNTVEFLQQNNFDSYVYTKFNSKNQVCSMPVFIYSRQDVKKIEENFSAEKKFKIIKDYDLNSKEDIFKLTNFRLVPGTKNLYRSFHPVVSSKGEFETEPYRMFYLNKLCEEYKIESFINLSSDRSLAQGDTKIFNPDTNSFEVLKKYLPQNVKSAESKNQIFYIMNSCPDFGYDECYMESKDKKFAQAVVEILRFINSVPGPYDIHCAIGTDRTGIVCAVISALCGATWQEICSDYTASCNMGILEYRGEGAVKYALEQFLGILDIYEEDQIQKKAIESLQKKTDITYEEIKEVLKRLG